MPLTGIATANAGLMEQIARLDWRVQLGALMALITALTVIVLVVVRTFNGHLVLLQRTKTRDGNKLTVRLDPMPLVVTPAEGQEHRDGKRAC